MRAEGLRGMQCHGHMSKLSYTHLCETHKLDVTV